MDHRLPATREMAQEFSELFVNRRAYTIQSMRPHPESGRHYYYRPKPKDGGEPVALTIETVRRHLAGELTIGIYAINPATQRCKWMAIDADYKTALEDLIKVQRQLQDDGIEAALEKSKRGGHLWIFFETSVLAREARIQGVVVLTAIIDKDGNIQNLRLVSGHPMLAPAAIDAVKQWRYKPFLLNGQPVEVETTVTVTFQMHM